MAPALALSGYRFCLTGRMWIPRKDVAQRIAMHGGIVHANLSHYGTILVEGKSASTKSSAKIQAAIRQRREVIGQNALMRVLEGKSTMKEELDRVAKVGAQPAPAPAPKRPSTLAEVFDKERHERATARFLKELEFFDER